MTFYVIDEIIEMREAAIKNPDGEYIGWADALEVDRLDGDTEKCPMCGRHVSLYAWLYPRKIRLSNTKYPDRLTSWIGTEFTVSERFVEAYNYTNLKGITKFNPVEIVSVAGKKSVKQQPPNYYCADVIRSNVGIDFNKSIIDGQKYDWSCEKCNPRGQTIDKVELLILDTSKWTGEDIFKVFTNSWFFATQNFVDFCSKNGFTNFTFTPVHEFRI